MIDSRGQEKQAPAPAGVMLRDPSLPGWTGNRELNGCSGGRSS